MKGQPLGRTLRPEAKLDNVVQVPMTFDDRSRLIGEARAAGQTSLAAYIRTRLSADKEVAS